VLHLVVAAVATLPLVPWQIARFSLYRFILSTIIARTFDRVLKPLEVPTEDHINFEPLRDELPRLFAPLNFPKTEYADERYKGIETRRKVLPIAQMIPSRKSGPIATNLEGLLKQTYPKQYKKVWPTQPVVPPELKSNDILAALAVSGPFAMYLEKKEKEYVIDMSFFEKYKPKEGLLPPGGKAIFHVEGDSGKLKTYGIEYKGKLVKPDDASYKQVSKLLLCALNTHLTTFLHNVSFHLAYVTPMVVSLINELSPTHPIRRLLHPATHTTLIGNHEIANIQVAGKNGFATSLFSYDYPTLTTMINEYLNDFKVAQNDPEYKYKMIKKLDGVGFALPYWEDEMALWEINREYVSKYVDHHYADDLAVSSDAELKRFIGSLDQMLPSGLFDDNATNYLPSGSELSKDRLVRLCASFLHTSSATHDVVNNAVWDYSTLNFDIPTQVPENGEEQDVQISFDLLTTLIRTWSPYNMLVEGISVLALDDTSKIIMEGYIRDLKERQRVMEEDGPKVPGRIYPNALNPSVSN